MPRYFFPRPVRATLLEELRDRAGVGPLNPDGLATLELDDTGCWVTCAPEQFDAVATVIAAHNPTAVDARAAQQTRQRQGARAAILATARGAVGKSVAGLTAAERNALLTVLLWGAGMITPDLTIAPLAEWARDDDGR